MDQDSRIEIFERMTSLAEVLSNEAQTLCELVDFIDDSEVIAKRVASLETEADVISHMMANRFRGSSLVEDKEAMTLFKIFAKLEECTDVIDDLASSIVAYNVLELRSEMIQDIVAINSCAIRVAQLVASLKEGESFGESQRLVIAINHFRDNAKTNWANNMRELFKNEKDPIEVIRWKEIISQIANVFSVYEHFADLCEEYLLKKAI